MTTYTETYDQQTSAAPANAETMALAVSASRAALGAGLLLAPRVFGRAFAGSKIDMPEVALATRLVGIRDVVLGLGAIIARRRGRPVRGWVEAGAAVDSLDFATVVLAGGALPLFGRLVFLAGAAGFAAAGFSAIRQLAAPNDAP